MINRALLRIGAEPLFSEADPGAEVHLAIYAGVLENVAAHPWSFMKITRRLVRLAAAPAQGFKYAYQMPADRVAGPRGLFETQDCRRRTTDFEIEGDAVLTDLEQLYGEFVIPGNTARWPGDFTELLTTAMMAELALSVREDRTLHAQLYQKAFGTPSEGGFGGLLGKALTSDNQSEPSIAIGDGSNPLIDVRW